MPDDFSPPTGAELDAALGSDFPTEPSNLTPEVESDAPAQTTQAVEEGATQPPPPPAEPAWNPEGPGDLRTALHQERERYRALQQEADQYRQMLNNPTLLSTLAAQYQQQQQAQQPAPPPEPIDFSQFDPVTDPEGAYNATTQYIQRLEQVIHQQNQNLQQLQHGIQTTGRESQFALAREIARQQYSDYDQVIQRLAPLENFLNPNAFLGPDGPQKAYQLAKMLASEQEKQTEVNQRVSEQAKRLLPVPPQAPMTLGKLPAAAPNTDAKPDPASLSHGQIEKLGVQDWYDRASRGAV